MLIVHRHGSNRERDILDIPRGTFCGSAQTKYLLTNLLVCSIMYASRISPVWWPYAWLVTVLDSRASALGLSPGHGQ